MRKLLLAGLAVATLTSQALVEAQEKEPAFDVASVKPSEEGPEGLLVLPGGTLEMTHMPISSLVAYAYGVRSAEVDQLPSWATRDPYTIRARTTAQPNAAQVRAMIRGLLRERFQLSAHVEQRPVPVYALVPVHKPFRPGSGLKRREEPCARGDRIKMADGIEVSCGGFLSGGASLRAVNLTMSVFAELLANLRLGQRVVDRSELVGSYDFTLSYSLDATTAAARGQADGIAPPTLALALEEQLGLRLESRREPSNVVVVDRIERPQPD
jgi:uncharacterized protein (TIGR03435 family)